MRRRYKIILLTLFTTLSLLLLFSTLSAWPVTHSHLWIQATPERIDPAHPGDKTYLLMNLGFDELSLAHIRLSAGTTDPVHVIYTKLWRIFDIEFGQRCSGNAFTTRTETGGSIPLYVLAILAAIPSAVGIFLLARQRRPGPGLCPQCGYDLRAHAPGQKCPECGTPIGAARI